MGTISLCMIVKNEVDVLERCLISVKDLVDEIIIVDTGSTDDTEKIARKYTQHVFSFQWIDDFSAARNFAFSKASMDYCMWLDADDVIEEQDKAGFLDFKRALSPDTDIVMMRYNTGFDEAGSPTFWYYRERLIKNNRGYLWEGAVHEVITPSGNIVYSDLSVSHKKLHPGDPDRNLNIYKHMLDEGRVLGARENYYYARELYYHGMFQEALEVFQRFLSSKDAWIENKIEACIMISKCCREIGDSSGALRALLASLEYDSPRAEVCCDIGSYFIESRQYEIAIFWYETASKCSKNFMRGGFINPDCYDYIPALQLCVCYDRLGQYDKANSYNEQAGALKPASPAYLYNKTYFNGKLASAEKNAPLS